MTLEVRLAPGVDQVDFLVAAEAWRGSREALRREALPADWAAARRTVQCWLAPDSPLAPVHVIWLEFDQADSGAYGVPFCFVNLDPDYLRHEQRPPPAVGAVMEVCKAGFSSIVGSPMTAPQQALLARCVAALPTGRRALHLGVAPERGTTAIRLGVILSPSETPQWLADIGWPGELRQFTESLALLGAPPATISVQVDVGDTLDVTLALEYYTPKTVSENPDWRRLFSALVERGVCDPAKAEAALAWPGSASLGYPDLDWPARLDRQLFVKLHTTPERLLAKAYLSVSPRYTLFGQ